MRVIECDECGETISAASDEELGRVARHLAEEHDVEEPDEEELTELVEAEAYEAMDSRGGMRHRALQHANCSIARTVSVLGERWTLVILRQAFLGARRFEDYQRGLGIARNMLADRLRTLVDEGILERRPYSERPPRHEYRLTAKGRDLYRSSSH